MNSKIPCRSIVLIIAYVLLNIQISYAELRAVQECGIKGYEELGTKLCLDLDKKKYGIFVDKRSDRCPPETYNRGTDAQACGTHKRRVKKFNWGCWESDNPHKHCREYYYEYVDASNSCEHPKFGVKTYKSCRHEDHGIEDIIPCPHESHGVIYNECEIRKTKDELELFLQYMNSTLDLLGSKFLLNQSTLIKMSARPVVGLSCLIQKWDGEEKLEKFIRELKAEFIIWTGAIYDPAIEINCESYQINLEDVECREEDPDHLCLAKRSYTAAQNALNNIHEEAVLLIDDVVAKQDPQMKERLLNLKKRIEQYLPVEEE